MTQTLVLIVAFIVANLPWLSDKLFYVIPLKAKTKNLAWCIFELLVLYFAVGFLALYAEFSVFGEISHQAWEFYAITLSLFVVLAFPGFIYKILWK